MGSSLESSRILLHHMNSPVSCLQIGSLQMKIIGEDKTMEQRTQDLFQEWEKEKPVQVDPSFFLSLSLFSLCLGKVSVLPAFLS